MRANLLTGFALSLVLSGGAANADVLTSTPAPESPAPGTVVLDLSFNGALQAGVDLSGTGDIQTGGVEAPEGDATPYLLVQHIQYVGNVALITLGQDYVGNNFSFYLAPTSSQALEDFGVRFQSGRYDNGGFTGTDILNDGDNQTLPGGSRNVNYRFSSDQVFSALRIIVSGDPVAFDDLVISEVPPPPPTPPSVPEPTTWALMLVGFGVLGTALRRGRRRVLAI